MKFIMGVFQTEAANCSPAAAVPAKAKIPVPMIAPIPMQVRANGPRTRFICRSDVAAYAIKWSGLFVRKSLEAICFPVRRFELEPQSDRDIPVASRSIQSFDNQSWGRWREFSS